MKLVVIVAAVLLACLVEQIALQLVIGTGAWWRLINVIFAIAAGWAGGKILAHWD